ncbi:MAG TPA: SGNH/GDSL hydrolase family protein [Polyangiaceae bacterium]|nr:SGNH/GDSL hydrolase family protein [Polyangiaceae bacterium]
MSTGTSYVFFALAVLVACRPEARAEPSATATASIPSPSSAPAPAEAPAVLETAASSPPPPVAAATPSASATPVSRKAHRVVVLGDSLSDPRVHGGHYLDGLGACPGITIDNFAKGGFMVNQMRRRFESEVTPTLTKDHTDLIVFGGVNDLYSDETAGRTVEKISADLTRIYDGAKAHGLRVIAITVAPWGGFTRYYNGRRGQATERLNAWIRQQQAEHRVDVVVDAAPLLACGDVERLCPEYEPPFHDGLHFGRLGHEKLSRALLDAAFAACRP